MSRRWNAALAKLHPFRVAVFIGSVWGLTFVILMIDTHLSKPNYFDQSDYVMTFYVAGHLVASGQASSLYPTLSDSSFAQAPLDQAAHRLLPALPSDSTAVFMYVPLVAWMFAALSKVSPNISLLIWQAISILSMLLSARFLAVSRNIKATEVLFLSALFLPIVITLWAGQVSLVIGLLPISAGFFLFVTNRPFLAGLAWSFVCLKPQLAFVPGFVICAFLFARRFRCAAGFVAGIMGLIALNAMLVPFAVDRSWVHALQLGEKFFSTGDYKIRDYLITSLPANILLTLPVGWRMAFKWPIYASGAMLWLIGIWRCNRLLNSGLDDVSKKSLIFLLATVLLSIASPYLLYYDLSVYLPAGVIIFGDEVLGPYSVSLKRYALTTWIFISGYMLFFIAAPAWLAQPLLLQLVLLIVAFKLFKAMDDLVLGSKLSQRSSVTKEAAAET